MECIKQNRNINLSSCKVELTAVEKSDAWLRCSKRNSHTEILKQNKNNKEKQENDSIVFYLSPFVFTL